MIDNVGALQIQIGARIRHGHIRWSAHIRQGLEESHHPPETYR